MFWQLAVVAAALGAAYYRWSRRRLYRLAKEIPTRIRGYPIVGHAHKFAGSSEDVINTIQEIGRESNRQEGLSSVWLGPRLFICATDPETIEVVLKTCLDKDEFTVKFTRPLIGYGSIFAPVNIWHPRRKVMAPFFSLKNLNQLVPVFQRKSSIMADLMWAEVGRGDFPIWKYMTTYTFDTVGETAIGTVLNSQVNPEHFMLRAIDELCNMVAKRFMQVWMHPDAIYKRLPVYKQFAAHVQRANAFVNEIIQKRRKRNTSRELEKDVKKSGWNNFLDTIMESSGGKEKGYTDEELREEVLVVMVAGNDTSAVGSSFTAVMLSRYPDVQERVYKELREVFGDSDRELTAEDLPKLKYMEAVIKESLRLYPPVPIVSREVHKDVLLPSGTTLVDGTSVAIIIWGVHRNPAYWGADAEMFRPERFLQGALPHPACFIPFSYSVRNCVGATYAMMSMKTALANLLRRYQLLPPANMAAADLTKPLRVKYDIMMKAVDNFIVRVEERKKISTSVLFHEWDQANN